MVEDTYASAIVAIKYEAEGDPEKETLMLVSDRHAGGISEGLEELAVRTVLDTGHGFLKFLIVKIKIHLTMQYFAGMPTATSFNIRRRYIFKKSLAVVVAVGMHDILFYCKKGGRKWFKK
jgi:hypothetical protein